MIRRPFRGPVGCVYSMSFGQRLRGDFQRFPGPGLSPSPGRSRLMDSRLLFPINVLAGTLAVQYSKDKPERVKPFLAKGY